jgi:hypothetical protein
MSNRLTKEEDTFRILARRPFEEARAALQEACRTMRFGATEHERQYMHIDVLWKRGWRTGEYLRECTVRGVPFYE